MTIDVDALIASPTQDEILADGLELAAALGLPTTTWRAGDPSRVLLSFLAEVLAQRENVAGAYIAAGFLSRASGDWLKLLATDVYGVTPTEATYATPTITLRNDGGGYYDLAAGDLTVTATVTGATFHSTSAGTLSAGATVTFDLVADASGSDGSVNANDIDSLVTTLPGVVVVSSTAAAGTDASTDTEIKTQCLASLGALSPMGPADAYEYVARNPDLTGSTGVTRAKASGSSGTGVVSVVVAGPSGAVSSAVVALVQSAIDLWAECLTADATAVSASALAVTLAVTVKRSSTNALSEAAITTAINSALVTLFQATPIGGVDGGIADSVVTAVIHESVPDGFTSVTFSGTALTLTSTQVPVLSSLTVTVL